MIMSASPAPACSRTFGRDAKPTIAFTSSVSLIFCISSGEESMTVTSFASAARWRAMLLPTCPAPQMMTFMNVRSGALRLDRPSRRRSSALPRDLDAERLQLPVQRRALHADEGRGAGNIAAEPVDLAQQILALEHFARVAPRPRHHWLAFLIPLGRASGRERVFWSW